MTAQSQDNLAGLLTQVLEDIKSIKSENARLNSQLDSINGKVNILSSVKQINESAEPCKSVVAVCVHICCGVLCISQVHWVYCIYFST